LEACEIQPFHIFEPDPTKNDLRDILRILLVEGYQNLPLMAQRLLDSASDLMPYPVLARFLLAATLSEQPVYPEDSDPVLGQVHAFLAPSDPATPPTLPPELVGVAIALLARVDSRESPGRANGRTAWNIARVVTEEPTRWPPEVLAALKAAVAGKPVTWPAEVKATDSPVESDDKAVPPSAPVLSPDGMTLAWERRSYLFNDTQAHVVEALMKEHLRGGIGLGEDHLRECADRANPSFRVHTCVRRHDIFKDRVLYQPQDKIWALRPPSSVPVP